MLDAHLLAELTLPLSQANLITRELFDAVFAADYTEPATTAGRNRELIRKELETYTTTMRESFGSTFPSAFYSTFKTTKPNLLGDAIQRVQERRLVWDAEEQASIAQGKHTKRNFRGVYPFLSPSGKNIDLASTRAESTCDSRVTTVRDAITYFLLDLICNPASLKRAMENHPVEISKDTLPYALRTRLTLAEVFHACGITAEELHGRADVEAQLKLYRIPSMQNTKSLQAWTDLKSAYAPLLQQHHDNTGDEAQLKQAKMLVADSTRDFIGLVVGMVLSNTAFVEADDPTYEDRERGREATYRSSQKSQPSAYKTMKSYLTQYTPMNRPHKTPSGYLERRMKPAAMKKEFSFTYPWRRLPTVRQQLISHVWQQTAPLIAKHEVPVINVMDRPQQIEDKVLTELIYKEDALNDMGGGVFDRLNTVRGEHQLALLMDAAADLFRTPESRERVLADLTSCVEQAMAIRIDEWEAALTVPAKVQRIVLRGNKTSSFAPDVAYDNNKTSITIPATTTPAIRAIRATKKIGRPFGSGKHQRAAQAGERAQVDAIRFFMLAFGDEETLSLSWFDRGLTNVTEMVAVTLESPVVHKAMFEALRAGEDAAVALYHKFKRQQPRHFPSSEPTIRLAARICIRIMQGGA